MISNISFFNGCFDKGRLKALISWSLLNCGEQFTIELVEKLKNLGFKNATKGGVSLSLDDLKIPPTKAQLISEAELQITLAHVQYQQGHLTAVEKFQQLIDTWHRTSETLKQHVIKYFKVTDILNPVYMMAFSGARGNVSQVRQLVGMRGLMADPQGQIINFPIRSNFREGLTLTEYIISCYGARKGLVDTALRTANSGYLTRRLVDVSQHVIVCQFDCGTQRGIFLSDMLEGSKQLISLETRLIGRILAEDIYTDVKSFSDKLKVQEIIFDGKKRVLRKNLEVLKAWETNYDSKKNRRLELKLRETTPGFTKGLKKTKLFSSYLSDRQNLEDTFSKVSVLGTTNEKSKFLLAKKNEEVSANLAKQIATVKKQVLVRSPLTCDVKKSICQLCYGWSLAHGTLVSLGEAVGILAAQSIGEPGTQLTMRTFHTGGVFSGDLMTDISAPFDGFIAFEEILQGILIRTPHGKIAFLTKVPGVFSIKQKQDNALSCSTKIEQKFNIPASTILFVREGEFVFAKQLIAEFSSISTRTDQRIKAKHNLNSEIEGQVVFKDVFLTVKATKEGEIVNRTARKLGSIWILSGQIYRTVIPTGLFPRPGDLVDSKSVMNQILIISPYTGFLAKNSSNNKNSIYFGSQNFTKNQLFKINRNQKNSFSKNTKCSKLVFTEQTKPYSFNELKNRYINVHKFAGSLSSTKKNHNPIKTLTKNNFSLNSSIFSFAIKKIFYYKTGYFLTFWNYSHLKSNFNPIFKYERSIRASLNSFSVLESLKTIKNDKRQNSVQILPLKTEAFKGAFYKRRILKKTKEKNLLGSMISTETPYNLLTQNYYKTNSCIPPSNFYHENLSNKTSLNFLFLSTSLKHQSNTLLNLTKFLFFQNFQNKYKTKTGGLAFYESFYFKKNRGIVFWVSEETYNINLDTLFIPTPTKFTLLKIKTIKNNNFNSVFIFGKNRGILLSQFSIVASNLINQSVPRKKLRFFNNKTTKKKQNFSKKTNFLRSAFPERSRQERSVRASLNSFAVLESQNTSILEAGRQSLKHKYCSSFGYYTEKKILYFYKKSYILFIATCKLNKKIKYFFYKNIKFFDKKLSKTKNKTLIFNKRSFKSKPLLSSLKISKCINKNLPIFSKYNSQGQILNFHCNSNGWLQIKNIKNTDISTKLNVKHQKKLKYYSKYFAFGPDLKRENNIVKTNAAVNAFLTPQLPRFSSYNIFKLKKHFSRYYKTAKSRNNSFYVNPYVLIKQAQINSSVLSLILSKNHWFLKLNQYKFTTLFLNHYKLTKLKLKPPFLNSLTFFNTTTYAKEIFDCNKLFTSIYLQEKQNNKIKKFKQFKQRLLFPYLKQNFIKNKQNKTKSFNKINNNSNFSKNFIQIGIKPGWIYFAQNSNALIKFHKQLLKPGFSFIDNLKFDQSIVYLECISLPFLSLDIYRHYFTSLQVQHKNLILKAQINLNNLLQEFNLKKDNFRLKSLINIKEEKKILNLKNNFIFADQLLRCKNLQLFLFKLKQFLLLIKKHNLTFTPFFTYEEVTFIKYGTPNFIRFGSKLTLFPEKIYRIKNQNQRYINLKEVKFKKVNFNNTQLNSKRTVKKNNLKEPNLSKKSNLLSSKFKYNNDRKFFYFTKAFFKLENETKLSKFKKGLIKQILVLNKNEFSFDNGFTGLKHSFTTNISRLNNELFNPRIFILIRKVKQYSIFKPKYYKTEFLKNTDQKTKLFKSYSLKNLIVYSWFNKQISTKLFSSFPSVDLIFDCSLRFKSLNHIYIYRTWNIIEFFILFNIPKKFPFKLTKVGISAKQNNCFTKKNLLFNHKFIGFKSPLLVAQNTNTLGPISLKKKFLQHYQNSFFNYCNIISTTTYLEIALARNLDNVNFMLPVQKELTNNFSSTELILQANNVLFVNNPLSLTNFFSPYEGEITAMKTDSLINKKQSCFLLTRQDQVSFHIENIFPNKLKDKVLLRHSRVRSGYSGFIGQLLRYGDQIANNLSTAYSGQIIQIDKFKIIIRKAQPILFSSQSVFYVYHGDFIEKNSPLITLFYQRLKTGDIVQGIPKIEQLFEARQTKEGEMLPDNLHAKLQTFFKKYKKIYSPRDAARKSFEKTQQLLVDDVQKVYKSQGVTIADKHLEVIVRQMTSKVRIIEGGQSGLLRGELIDLSWIEMVNASIKSQKAEYEPIILGITKAALETESFISAASFQETTRILAKAAIERKTDFLRGLKENVILGHLIPAGTGFSRSFEPKNTFYSNKIENASFFKKIFLSLQKAEASTKEQNN